MQKMIDEEHEVTTIYIFIHRSNTQFETNVDGSEKRECDSDSASLNPQQFNPRIRSESASS